MSSDVWTDLLSDPQFEDRGPYNPAKIAKRLKGLEARSFNTDVEGETLTIHVVLPATFPIQIPVVILDQNDLGVLPHVDEEGVVCIMEQEGLLVDTENPARIAHRVAVEAVAILGAGIAGTNVADLAEEFEAYWGVTHASRRRIRSFAQYGDEPEVVWAHEKKGPGGTIRSVSDTSEPPSFPGRLRRRARRSYRALYIPLIPEPILLSTYNECWDARRLREIVKSHVAKDDLDAVLRLVKDWHQRRHLVLLGLPRKIGRSVFGVVYRNAESQKRSVGHPLVDNGTMAVAPVVVERLDRQYLIERGGGDIQLASTHVVVVGCGAVGSVIAELLARSGVGELTLIDPDRMSWDNAHRHVLSGRQAGKGKSALLKKLLHSQFPHLKVKAVPATIESALLVAPSLLDQASLVVQATGNPTVDLFINDHVRDEGPPLVVTWLEPLGIGGHALLCNADKTASGCFRCLFEHEEWNRNHGWSNVASFAAPNQHFTKRISGCQTAFVPFGGIHASRTACLAAELAVDFLRGRTADHPLRSWKGDCMDFHEAGFATSARFDDYSQTELESLPYIYKSPTCPICAPH